MMAFGRSPTCSEDYTFVKDIDFDLQERCSACAHIWAAAMELFSTTSSWTQPTCNQTGWYQQRRAVEAAQTEGKHLTAHTSSLQPAARLAACILQLH